MSYSISDFHYIFSQHFHIESRCLFTVLFAVAPYVDQTLIRRPNTHTSTKHSYVDQTPHVDPRAEIKYSRSTDKLRHESIIQNKRSSGGTRRQDQGVKVNILYGKYLEARDSVGPQRSEIRTTRYICIMCADST